MGEGGKERSIINTELMFSSKKDDWETPQWLFDELDSEFHFTLDPCANELNHKCAKISEKPKQTETRKYTGGSCCWPIDQCRDCPNHPERKDKENK